MKDEITVIELRKKLKPWGFTVRTKALSFGISGTIVRLSDKQTMPSMFPSAEDRNEWLPALKAIENIRIIDAYGDRVSGPWS